MSYLLDTNVVSEFRKAERADRRVMAWVERERRKPMFISALTVGELRCGVEQARRRDLVSARALETWLAQVITTYADRVLDIDTTIVQEWGRMAVPDPLPIVDGLIAATAKVRGLVLATRSVSDILRTGVSYVNPFEAP